MCFVVLRSRGAENAMLSVFGTTNWDRKGTQTASVVQHQGIGEWTITD